MNNFINQLKKIKLVIFDFEGVLSIGNEVVCSKRMKLFLNFLNSFNIKTALISCSNFDSFNFKHNVIDFNYVKFSSYNKVSVAEEILELEKIDFNEVLYIGDDILDLPVISKAGLSLAPINAHKLVLRQTSEVIKGDNPNEIILNLYKLFELALVINN